MFAECIYKAICFLAADKDTIVVPVPPRPGKIKERGWDQIEDIAQRLSKRSVPVLRCLERTGGMQQKLLGKKARAMNLRGCIAVKPEILIPKHVILIDDLATTGATLDACAVELKNAGCETVRAITLFYD